MSVAPAANASGSRFSVFRKGSGHTASSAALLLMMSSVLSGVLALVRIKYVNQLFGAGVEQDAYRAAFKLPDLLAYFLVGSAASVSMITMLNRFRQSGDEDGADRALSVVLMTMLVVLGGAMLVAGIAAPLYVKFMLGDEFLHDARGPLCISLTRILLPAQLFFFIGSMMSARLQVRKIFLYQACTPVIYNGGILLGAWLLHRQMGVYSLAVGVLGGVIIGSALLNTLGALRTGLHFHPRVNFSDPAFLEWFRAALPLMVGVSLVMFDGLFFNRFASKQVGQLTIINNAKDLFNAPFNVIGPAAGAASLPFFASLFQQGKTHDFSVSVSRSVSRLASVGLLVSAWMIGLGPWLMDLLRSGKFNHTDAAETNHLFRIFAVTLAIWAVQGIYARAFYAASDTKTPAVAGTTIVVLSLPLYWLLYRSMAMTGLALASDIGIVVQTATLAILLHRKRLVSFSHLELVEIGRALLASAVAGLAIAQAANHLPNIPLYSGLVKIVDHVPHASAHAGDIVIIFVGSLIWIVVAGALLVVSGSKLPQQILRRRAA